jgi:hypothetical protein
MPPRATMDRMGPRRLAPIVVVAIVVACLTAVAGAADEPADPAQAKQGPVVAGVPQAPVANPALPPHHELLAKMRAAIRFDDDVQQAYTYVERRRDVKVSMLGKVSVGPLRTFEVYPSNKPGRTYKRLVAIDGKPLPADELARRDEAHRNNMIAELARDKTETPAARKAREAKDAADRREKEALVNDAFGVFEARVAGYDTIDGQPVTVLWISPRRNAQPKTREGRYMTKFAGKIWVVEADGEIVKLDLSAFDDIPVGMGIVGRVHEGARLEFARRRVNNEAWLPSTSHITAKGKTLMFRPFSFDLRTEYRDYRKFSVDTKVTYEPPKQ